jgi:hypothetical protein
VRIAATRLPPENIGRYGLVTHVDGSARSSLTEYDPLARVEPAVEREWWWLDGALNAVAQLWAARSACRPVFS